MSKLLLRNGQAGKAKFGARFELLEKLGRGSTATVYRACDRASGQTVAIKVGARLLHLDRAAFERFQREFTVVRHLRHPNLVAALDFGEEKQAPYIVLEFVDGPNLEKRLKDEGAMPPADAVDVILQVAEGLHFLHRKQILHRDVKPGNVFLTSQGQAKLGDFGVLKILAPERSLTRTHKAMGTVEYGAPEQFEDAKRTDFRCDLYALAGTLYTTLTGLFPFGVGSPLRILQRKHQNQIIPLSYLLSRILPELEDLVAQALQADRERRPASMDEFIDRLRCIREALPSRPAARTVKVPPLPESPGSPDRRTAIRVAVTMPAAFVPFHEYQRGSWKATIADVSAGGLCLRTPTLCPVNTLLELTLPSTGTARLAQVRWLQKAQDQHYILGCSFVRPLTRREIAEFFPPSS